MMKSALVIALILCLPAAAGGDDRTKVSSRVRGLFCSSPNGFSDCVGACAAQDGSIDRYRACAAICRKQFHC